MSDTTQAIETKPTKSDGKVVQIILPVETPKSETSSNDTKLVKEVILNDDGTIEIRDADSRVSNQAILPQVVKAVTHDDTKQRLKEARQQIKDAEQQIKDEEREARKEVKRKEKLRADNKDVPVQSQGSPEPAKALDANSQAAQVTIPVSPNLFVPIPFATVQQLGLDQRRVLPEKWATVNTEQSTLWLHNFLKSNNVIPPTAQGRIQTLQGSDGTIRHALRYVDQSGSVYSKVFFMYCNSMNVCPFGVYNDSTTSLRITPRLTTGDLINTGSSVAASPVSNYRARVAFNYYHQSTDTAPKHLGVRFTDSIVPDKRIISRENAVLIGDKFKAQEAANAISLMHHQLVPISVQIRLR